MRVENATPRPAAKLARAGNEDDMGSARDDRRGALRIGVLITELLVEGGGERQAVYLARELQDMGHDVVLYTTAHDPQRCYPEVCAQLRVVVTGGHPLARLPVPSRRLRDYLNMRHLARHLRGPFDVLNPHHWPPHWAAVGAARRSFPPPAVVWMCNDPPWHPPSLSDGSPSGFRRLTSPLRRLTSRAQRWHDLRTTADVSKIVVLSGIAKRQVDATYGADCKVVRSGVDLASLRTDDPAEPADIRREHAISSEAFLLLALGILMPHRRLEDALAGVATAVAEGHDIHFLIVGSPLQHPDYADHLRTLTNDLGLGQRVTFTGAVPDNRLPLYYRACDAFIFPNENQTWGLAVTEAMAYGKPAIVSTGATVQEILEDGKTAFLVPPRRPDAIATVLCRLIDSPELRMAVAERGRQHVLNTLSWRRYAQAMLGIFEESIALLRGGIPGMSQGQTPVAGVPREASSRREAESYVSRIGGSRGALSVASTQEGADEDAGTR